MGQIWIPDWIDKHIPIKKVPWHRMGETANDYRKDNKHQLQIRANFNYWMKWWDPDYNGTGTYDDDLMACNLGYAIQDYENGIKR